MHKKLITSKEFADLLDALTNSAAPSAITLRRTFVQAMCNTIQALRNETERYAEIAKMAHGGEIPSPLYGHPNTTEEEMVEQFQHLNCPYCGGSGHIEDTKDEAHSRLLDSHKRQRHVLYATMFALDWMSGVLSKSCKEHGENPGYTRCVHLGECPFIDDCVDITPRCWLDKAYEETGGGQTVDTVMEYLNETSKSEEHGACPHCRANGCTRQGH